MKTIEEHNKERWEQIEAAKRTNTGIECPMCHAELHYADNVLRCSSPPQRQVKCLNCDHITYILA